MAHSGKKMVKAWAVASVALALAACGSTPLRTMEHRLQTLPVEQRAYIVGLYVVGCDPQHAKCRQGFNSISADYRGRPDRDIGGQLYATEGAGFTSSADTQPDFVDRSRAERGFFFCEAIVPGQYEFHRFSFSNLANGGSGYSVPERSEFSVPFHAAAGEVVNLGRVKLHTAWGTNLIGLRVPGPGPMAFAALSGEELQKALAKCPPAVRSVPIAERPLQPPVTPSPFILQDSPSPTPEG